jgi:hypothetical protein
VSERNGGTYAVIVHVHIRLTDLSGICLEGSKVVSRRKRLCRDWFNDDWAKKVAGIMRYISDGGKIVIGDTDKDTIVINGRPCMWTVPISINEKALTYESVAIEETLIESYDNDEG